MDQWRFFSGVEVPKEDRTSSKDLALMVGRECRQTDFEHWRLRETCLQRTPSGRWSLGQHWRTRTEKCHITPRRGRRWKDFGTAVSKNVVWWSKGLTEKWVAISKLAIPLKVGAAAAAEIAGVCVLTGIVDLILSKCLSVKNINLCINSFLNNRGSLHVEAVLQKHFSHGVKLWACLWTALRATVPSKNIPGRFQLESPRFLGINAALAQSIEHVVARGCRDGDWRPPQWTGAHECQVVAGSKRLHGSHDWQNVAPSRNGSQCHENAKVCSAEVLAGPHFG